MSSLQNPSLISFNHPGWFIGIPLLDNYYPQYMKGSLIHYNHPPRQCLNTAQLGLNHSCEPITRVKGSIMKGSIMKGSKYIYIYKYNPLE